MDRPVIHSPLFLSVSIQYHIDMEQLAAALKKISSDIADNILHEDGILEIRLREGVEIDGLNVMDNIKAARALTGGKKHPVLIDARVTFTVTQKARELSARNSKERVAKAVLINSLAGRLIGNFYINFHKPATPTRLFTSREEAIEWLKKFM